MMPATAEPCRFCEIVRGDLPAWRVMEDETTIAFLDRRPLFPGHILLIPRLHVVTLPELPEELVAPLFITARFLATVVEEALEAEGSFVAMNNRVSQSVPHLHIHIVPRHRGDGLKGFFWPRNSYASEAEALAVQERLRAAIGRRLG
jgi:histidine triad (HIT) family protein